MQLNQGSKDELDNRWNEFRIYVYGDVGNDIDDVLTDLAWKLRLPEQPGNVD